MMDIIKSIKRLIAWDIALVIMLLIDEYIKEGYLIKIDDFIKPFTHENILSVLITTLIILIILLKREKKG
jgi:hypothetical protein